MPSLVIVDVQKEFSAAKYVVPHVLKLIKEFKANKFPIIVLEYGSIVNGEEVCYYDTYKIIMGHLIDYPLFKHKCKLSDSGAREVDQALKELNYHDKEIAICGVNTSACVYETVRGLTIAKYKINVIKKACNDNLPKYHKRQIEQWENSSKISVIG